MDDLLEALQFAEARLEELGEHELVGKCAAAFAKFKEKNTPQVVPQCEPVGCMVKGRLLSFKDNGIPDDCLLYLAPPSVEAAIDWSNLDFQCHALQQIGANWYDGKVRNQWIADTCHEMKKHIAAAIRSMR